MHYRFRISDSEFRISKALKNLLSCKDTKDSGLWSIVNVFILTLFIDVVIFILIRYISWLAKKVTPIKKCEESYKSQNGVV